MTDAKITSLPLFQEIDREAAEWVVRLDREDVPASTLLEFEQWRSQSSQHREAADRLEDFWAGMAELDIFNDLHEMDAVAARRPKSGGERFRRRSALIWGAAACLAAILGVAAYQTLLVNPAFQEGYKTAVGEQRTIDLPDGSRVVLNTDSIIKATYTKTDRIIRLVRGEAYFDVQKNPARPFSVETDRGAVTAVGTAFSVRLVDQDMNVLVSEGRVRLSAAPLDRASKEPRADAPEEVEVAAGEAAVFDRSAKTISAIDKQDMDRQLDWKDGVLEFHGDPLMVVVADISRYTDITIEIENSELANRRVVAYYQVGKIEPMFEALRLTANVEVDWVNEKHVRLHIAR